jgi:predicted metalloprotease
LNSLIRPRLLLATALLLVLGAAAHRLTHDDTPAAAQVRAGSTQADRLVPLPSGAGTNGLVLGSRDSAQPTNMTQFLTAVTKDVDAYWSSTFKASGLPEPKVGYTWIPAGQAASSACGEAGTLGDSAAAYCPGDDTIYISEKFASDIYNGALDHALPGSAQGYGRTIGDFSVAYIVAHEYGHQIQHELGLFEQYGDQIPTMAFELQADCYAGTWAKSAYQQNRLEDGDVQEALDAALAVGDFDTANPVHHGTPQQRAEAWNSGFESGDPSACSAYLDPAGLGDGSAAAPHDTGSGYAPEQGPAYPEYGIAGATRAAL